MLGELGGSWKLPDVEPRGQNTNQVKLNRGCQPLNRRPCERAFKADVRALTLLGCPRGRVDPARIVAEPAALVASKGGLDVDGSVPLDAEHQAAENRTLGQKDEQTKAHEQALEPSGHEASQDR